MRVQSSREEVLMRVSALKGYIERVKISKWKKRKQVKGKYMLKLCGTAKAKSLG